MDPNFSYTIVEVEDFIVFLPQCMIQIKCLSSSMMTNNILSTELFTCGRGLSLPIHRKKGWQAAGTAGKCINLIGIYFNSKYCKCFLVNDLYYGQYKNLIELVNFSCIFCWQYIALPNPTWTKTWHYFNISLAFFFIPKPPCLHDKPKCQTVRKKPRRRNLVLMFLRDRIPGA